MHLLKCASFFASLIPTLCFSATVPQVPIEIGLPDVNSYGYERCGFYRLINYKTVYALSTNSSDPAAGIVSMPVTEGDDAQRWLLMYVSSYPRWMIVNAGTGALLSAVRSGQPARAALVPHYDLWNRWFFARELEWTDPEVHPLVIYNLGFDNVLDLSHGRRAAGVPIITYPPNNPVTKNQN